MTLETARSRASNLTQAARAGRDLVQEEERARVLQAQRLTVAELINRYSHAKRKAGLRTADEIDRRLRRSLQKFLACAADELRRRDVRSILDDVAESGREREAEKRRQVISAMFGWGLSQDFVEVDPTHGLAAYGSSRSRDRVLDEQEIRTFIQWLPESLLPSDHIKVLHLQLLLGARCGEIAGMARAEIDTDRWIWTLPGERSKNRRSRVTPLVGSAQIIVREALQNQSRNALFLAESGAVLRSTNVGQALIHRRAKCPVAHFTTHDLRRTFVSQLVDLGVPIELVAALVGHEAGARETRTLFRHYVKTDQLVRKKAALKAWDAHLVAICTGALSSQNIMQLPSRQR